MPEILEVAVIGVPEPKWGEVGCAVAVIKPGKILTQDMVATFCKTRLARFKQLAKFVLVDALPRTATDKVLKFALCEVYSK